MIIIKYVKKQYAVKGRERTAPYPPHRLFFTNHSLIQFLLLTSFLCLEHAREGLGCAVLLLLNLSYFIGKYYIATPSRK